MFLPQYEKRNSNNWLPISFWIGFYFEFLMPSFAFHFHKKMENKIQFIFRFSFSWRNRKTNYLRRSRLTLWLLSQVWSTHNSRASSCQIPESFPLCNDHADTKDPLYRTADVFYVYIADYYFNIWFIFIINCDRKHTSRSSHRELFF